MVSTSVNPQDNMNALITRYKKYKNYGGYLNTQQTTAAGTGVPLYGAETLQKMQQNKQQLTSGLNDLTSSVADSVMPGLGKITGLVNTGLSSLVENIGPKDENGVGSFGTEMAKSFATGSPITAVVGGLNTAINYTKMKAASNTLSVRKRMAEEEMHRNDLVARKNADPTLLTGTQNASYFAMGGKMGVGVDQGTPLSSTATEFKGPSHSKGGIQLPQFNAEVEGGETQNAGYVFSEQLGFADVHKRIAKAIGKIEQKAMRPERVKSLELLKKKENDLKQSQEMVKAMLGIN